MLTPPGNTNVILKTKIIYYKIILLFVITGWKEGENSGNYNLNFDHQTLLFTLSALGNKAWLDIPLAAVWGLQSRGEVLADRRDGEEKEGETGDACLGFTAEAYSPSSWPYCFTGQPL